MRVLLVQLDGKIPNLALMRLAGHHLRRGDQVELIQVRQPDSVDRTLWDAWDVVYASAIFAKTRPVAERLLRSYPHAIIGGTGWGPLTIEEIGVAPDQHPDYSLWPGFTASIGFSQRGCRLNCASFCVVPKKEGKIKDERSVLSIWRGEPWPRHLLLLDNDFFGSSTWRDRVQEINAGGFKVCLSQGINARFLDDETAAAMASMRCCDDQFKGRRIYTAWDNRRDEDRLFAGLEALRRHGVSPDDIMVYMLIGHWPGETEDDWEFRRRRLREFGARPYPMPFNRTPAEMGFQRFCIGAHDKRWTWQQFTAAKWQPRNLWGAA